MGWSGCKRSKSDAIKDFIMERQEEEKKDVPPAEEPQKLSKGQKKKLKEKAKAAALAEAGEQKKAEPIPVPKAVDSEGEDEPAADGEAPKKKKNKNKKKSKNAGVREQDNSHIRNLGSWLPGEWKQTDPPTKPVS